ncbi:hypothetical protein LEMLEM_LOCUS2517, partial [Lemmus lemmus]
AGHTLTHWPFLLQTKCGTQLPASVIVQSGSTTPPSWEMRAALSHGHSMLLAVNGKEIKQEYGCSVPMAARPSAHWWSMLPHKIEKPLLPFWPKTDAGAESTVGNFKLQVRTSSISCISGLHTRLFS